MVEALMVNGFVLLGVSGVRHARWRGPFVDQLQAQGLWRRPPPVATAVTVVELLVAVGGLVVLAAGADGTALRMPLAALVVVGVAFTGFQVVLALRSPEAPCGCDPNHGGPVGPSSLVKAFWPVVCGVVGLTATHGLDQVLPALVGLVLAVAVDRLPQR